LIGAEQNKLSKVLNRVRETLSNESS